MHLQAQLQSVLLALGTRSVEHLIKQGIPLPTYVQPTARIGIGLAIAPHHTTRHLRFRQHDPLALEQNGQLYSGAAGRIVSHGMV
ncbi:hypothetical protein D3C71_1774790 [compost metagenome]